MIDPTGASTASTFAAPSTSRAAKRAGKDFAGELATLVAKTASPASSTSSTKAATAKAAERPDGEQTKKIAGHPYSRVENGTDKGKYLNQLGGSPREGSVFELVKRDDRVFHVYGSGEDRVIVEVKAADAKQDSAATKPTGGATPATT